MIFKSFHLKQNPLCLTIPVVFMFTAVKTQVNIASKLSIKICNNGTLRGSPGATDGIRDQLSDNVTASCQYESISAKSKEKYYIHYLVLYGEMEKGWLEILLNQIYINSPSTLGKESKSTQLDDKQKKDI